MIPFWKKWLSHLFPLTLEETSSEHNPDLAVVLDRGRLQLLSGNAIYSWDDLYHNFTIAFGTIDLDEEHIEDVLVLGLGLGSVPYILEKVFERRYRYTAIELDEVVSELAAKYTLPRLSSPVEIITADAGIFVAVTEEQFDLIVVDIFEDDHTPEQFEETDFLEACKAHLRPGGILLYNRLHNNAKTRLATERFYENRFRVVFPDAWAINTGGNWIVAARHPAAIPPSRRDYL
ncbi:MAG: methyltransferase domain-containing protein [Lewinellaceae bacterium]|nr:methyltransferase domain-containing protein [Lewinellaceae bacterium]